MGKGLKRHRTRDQITLIGPAGAQQRWLEARDRHNRQLERLNWARSG
jgi:hypothetical protein